VIHERMEGKSVSTVRKKNTYETLRELRQLLEEDVPFRDELVIARLGELGITKENARKIVLNLTDNAVKRPSLLDMLEQRYTEEPTSRQSASGRSSSSSPISR